MSSRQQLRHAERRAAKANRPVPKGIARNRRLAFKAAKAQFAEVGAILKETAGNEAERIARLRLIGPLRHRGKGRGAIEHRHGQARSAYQPHQGQQERLRRLVGGFASVHRASETKRSTIAAVSRRLPLSGARRRHLEEAFA